MVDDVFNTPAVSLLVELADQGYVVRLTEAGKLHVEPGSRLTPDQRRLLVEHKASVAMLLRCCDEGVAARRDVFRALLEAEGPAILPLLVFTPELPYVAGACFSCGEPTGRPVHGRCWRCSLAWRLACRLPISSDLAAEIDRARLVA